MEVRPGYKQAEVGVIPEEWQTSKVGDVCGCIVPGRNKPRLFDGDIPWITTPDLETGKLVTTSRLGLCISRTEAKSVGSKIVPPGSVLMSCAGELGIVAMTSHEIVVNQQLHVFVPTDRIEAVFLLNALAYRRYQIENIGTKTAVPYLNKSACNSILVPLPPVPEQRAIAEALSDVDALLGGLDQLIAKKRDLKHAAMQQLLTGQTRLPGFGPSMKFKRYAYGSIPADWDVKPLKLVSTMSGRIGWQGLKQDEFTESPDDPFLITGMNFKDGKIRWSEVYHIPEKRYLEAPPIQLRVNDILMTKDGTIGKLLYVEAIPHPGKASLNSHLLVFRPINGQYEPRFLFYQLSSPTFAQHVELHKSGSTFYGLTQGATGKYPVILPSVPEQTAIARVLSDIDAELTELERRREKTRALKQGMMQELLTGRTRLV